MSAVPWVKWFSGDFLNGISDLNPNEIAVYVVVLNLIYDAGGPIKNDVNRIARRCNMRPTTCERVIDDLVSGGKLSLDTGSISNGRCEKEIKSRQKVSEKSAEKAHARWSKVDEKPSKINEDQMPVHDAGICRDDAIQKPEPEENSEPKGSSSDRAPQRSLIALALDAFNRIAKDAGWPQAKLTEGRRAPLRKRLEDCGGLAGWVEALQRAARSSLLTGGGDRGWRADIDFFLKPAKFTKLIEGSYDDHRPAANRQAAPANGYRSGADTALAAAGRAYAQAVDAERRTSGGDEYFTDAAPADDRRGEQPVWDDDGERRQARSQDAGPAALFLPPPSLFS